MPPAARLDARQLLGTAEKLLAARDLAGCRRYALQALDADPLLDGVDQVLAAADVLLAAEKRVNNHLDWYAILRIDPLPSAAYSAVDLATIKRKYRKLALLLHPDKNKSVGAESAFKLVLDAWSLLSDPAKRALYDKEREIASHLSGRAAVGAEAEAARGAQGSFWTGCPYCYHMHEFRRFYENRNLRCPKCRHAFLAAEVKSMPQMAPGMDAYYFNWGYSYPMAVGGFPGAGYGGSAPSPYLGMPNMMNPFFPPSVQPGAAPTPAPVEHGRGSVGSPAGNSGVNEDKEWSGGRSMPADVRRRVKSRKGANVNPARMQEKSPRAKPMTPVVSAAPVRHSPRLEKLKKESVHIPVYKEEDVVEDKEVAMQTKKAARKATQKSLEKKAKKGSKTDDGGENGSIAAGAEMGSSGVKAGSFQNERGEPVLSHGDMQDPDISDILNSLPKIYDMKGEEVEINI